MPPAKGRVAKRSKKPSKSNSKQNLQAHKRACEAGRQRKREQEARAAENGEEPPPRRKVRKRGEQAARELMVRGPGDERPNRKSDDAVKNAEDQKLDRKTRELFALIEHTKRERREADAAEDAEDLRFVRQPRARHEGQREGERYGDFRRRLREETRQERLRAGRENNHQRGKKRAYWERKRERAARRNRHRGGIFSDNEDENEMMDEDDEKPTGFSSINPGVELLHERLLLAATGSKKKKNRMDSDETPWDGAMNRNEHELGEFRPLDLSKITGNRKVAISNAATLLE